MCSSKQDSAKFWLLKCGQRLGQSRAGLERVRHWTYSDKVQSEAHVKSRCKTAGYARTAMISKVLLGEVLGRVLNCITLASTSRAEACLASHKHFFCSTRKVSAGGYVATYTGKELGLPMYFVTSVPALTFLVGQQGYHTGKW